VRNQTTAERIQVRKDRTQSSVAAKTQENFYAGVGVVCVVLGAALIVYTVQAWSTTEPAARIAIIAFALGMIWFGALSVLRFSLDEVKDLYQYLRMQEMLVEKEAKLQELSADNQHLREELRKVRATIKTQEFNQASAGARVVKAEEPTDKHAQLLKDVDEIIHRWQQGLKYGRDHCTMGKGRWGKATSFLLHCGVMIVEDDQRGTRTFADGMTPAKAEAKINRALGRIEKFKDTNYVPPLS
jgi:hypothetical protein